MISVLQIISLKRIVTGTASGGYFGAAITSAGDMDADGLDGNTFPLLLIMMNETEFLLRMQKLSHYTTI